MTDELRTRYAACPLCEASCGLEIVLDGDRVRSIRGHEADPLSRGHLCPKAIALQDLHEDPDRLRRPVRRLGDRWVEIPWAQAFTLAAELLHGVQERHGRNSLGVYLGNPNVHSLGAMTHNPQLVRALGTRSVYSATSVDQLPHHMVAWALYGHQFLLPVPDIDRTDLLVLIGHNPMASNGSMWTVPDFPQRRRELSARGGRLIVLDPRRTETAKIADRHLPVRPGTDAWVLLALIREVLASGRARPAAYVDGVEEVRGAVESFTPELAAERSGVPAAEIRQLASDLLDAPAAAIHGRMGVSVQSFGLLCQWAIQVLNILIGGLDRSGGLMFTSPAVDLVGRGLMGAGRPGRRTRVRGLQAFGSELPSATLAEEIRTPGEGQLRGLITIAGNPVSSTPGGHLLDGALSELEAMVSIDPYINETTRHAHLILPPTGPLERDHYDVIFHTLAVRNTARFSPAVLPADPEARHDWQIARDLVSALERARGGRRDLARWLRMRVSPRLTVDALLRLSPTRLSVRRLSRTPGGVDLGPLRSQLPERLRTADQRIHLAAPLALAELTRLRQAEPAVAADTLLLIGRRHQRDNNSWMHNAARLTSGRARHHLLVNPEDLAARGIPDGSLVTVRSAAGEVQVEAAASTDLMPGVVSLPHGYGHARQGVRLARASALPGVSINDLTDPNVVDLGSGNAVLNGIPVTITASSDEG